MAGPYWTVIEEPLGLREGRVFLCTDMAHMCGDTSGRLIDTPWFEDGAYVVDTHSGSSYAGLRLVASTEPTDYRAVLRLESTSPDSWRPWGVIVTAELDGHFTARCPSEFYPSAPPCHASASLGISHRINDLDPEVYTSSYAFTSSNDIRVHPNRWSKRLALFPGDVLTLQGGVSTGVDPDIGTGELHSSGTLTVTATIIPEPETWHILLVGLPVLVMIGHRRRRVSR
jgi:hypothetical protein